MPDTNFPKEFLRQLRPRLPEMLSTLKRFVCAESPSLEKAFADRCCTILDSEWRKRGARVERIAQKTRGDQLRITWWPHKSRPAGQFFVLGHYDTVYASGTLAKMPCRISRGKAYGPGIFDMKAGIVQALFALDTIQRTKTPLTHRLVFLWTSDEEIGSDCSRKVIESEARRSDAVFVLEPSLGPKGLIKTARKGVGEAELIIHGRASHAGLAPQEGINAIHELAGQLVRIKEWNHLRNGVSINADVVEGGTRVNVIAERARAILDLRALRVSDMRRIERRLHALHPILRGARLEIHGGFNRPPLERKSSAALFAKAKALAAQMGLSLGECTAGGGSDGNLTAAVGTPTLDGLGAVGHGAHSSNEHIFIHTMPERAALLASLLLA
ncbi:MAG TPA: M20/M25/M40 family metallo-hydrolase [Candidatus Solibacter sp.]|nr:M20/M25/M40 family metallo-hydrolase [Candidatus Solibacter sp.]